MVDNKAAYYYSCYGNPTNYITVAGSMELRFNRVVILAYVCVNKAITFYGLPTTPVNIDYDFSIESGEKRVDWEQVTLGPNCLGIIPPLAQLYEDPQMTNQFSSSEILLDHSAEQIVINPTSIAAG